MKRWLDQLKPQERRWVVGIGFIVFLMLNYFFVWPHFGDWRRDNARMEKAQQQIEVYNKELRHKPDYERRLRELQADGSSVLPEDQAIDFIRFVNARAVSNKVVITTQGTLTTRTNEFFIEQQMGITVVADETNLVSFLYSMGAGNSMMRVRAMSLHPDQSHQNLNASVTLVANYQKKAAPRATTPAPSAKTASAAPKPQPVAETAPAQHGPVVIPNTRSNRVTNIISKAPGITATNKTGPSIAKRP